MNYTYPDGSKYEGDMKDNKRHGKGMLTRTDGTIFIGQWENDLPSGHGTLTNPDGSMYAGEWKAGKRHGHGVINYASGTRLVGQWVNGEFADQKNACVEQDDYCRELEQANWELKQKIVALEERGGGLKKRKQISFSYLKSFNLKMGFLHFIQGGLMLYFATNVDQIKAFKIPIWSYFLEFNSEIMRLVTKPEQLFEFPFALFVSFFLFLSALAHFIIVFPKSNDRYVRDLKKGINIYRWYEYSLSSSLMIILIAMLFGVYDIGALIVIFILNAAMNWFGLLMERINQYSEKTIWSPFVFGSIAGIGPWIVIIMYALGNADPAQVPWFVYAIIGSYFVFFNLFPINMFLQYKRIGRWADYLYGERGYIILSLFAKSVLAWLVFFGVMQPT